MTQMDADERREVGGWLGGRLTSRVSPLGVGAGQFLMNWSGLRPVVHRFLILNS